MKRLGILYYCLVLFVIVLGLVNAVEIHSLFWIAFNGTVTLVLTAVLTADLIDANKDADK